MPPKRRAEASSSSSSGQRRSTRSKPTTNDGAVSVADSPTTNDSPSNSRGSSSRSETVQRNKGGRRSGKSGANSESKMGIPDVYKEMLRDVVCGESSKAAQERAVKRRKTMSDEDVENDMQIGAEDPQSEGANGEGGEDEQDSDESDADWEEVDLSKKPIAAMSGAMNTSEISKDTGPLEIVLGDKEKQNSSGSLRRKITAVDRRIRLEVHKLHLLCLLVHVYRRNKWCNSSAAKENLRPLITEQVFAKLNPNPQDQVFRRSKLFLEGLQQALEMWKRKFRITRNGLSKPHWKDPETLKNTPPPKDCDPPMNKEDFINACSTLKGSRDIGAQLFCALLRSAGVTARLVCSLQPLSFSFGEKNTGTPVEPPITLDIEESDNTSDDSNAVQVNSHSSSSTPTKLGTGGSLRRPRLRQSIPTPVKKAPKINITHPPYPVYWVEAWSVAQQKWIAVDPLVTMSVGKPSVFEPPMTDAWENSMSYVVGFEEEGQAKDVTRRYVKSFNGRTRRLRVSSTKGGKEWWDKVLSVFQRGWELDRDQVEDAELVQREVSEGIPKNVQDLKDHPLFALKRHLKRHEILHPEKTVGSITIGIGQKKSTEQIFRRQDVKTVKSSIQWYRLGREIKSGEQPMKYVVPRRRFGKKKDTESGDDIDEEDQDDGQTALYAESQTILYEPPEILNGIVPKNGFGNLDIFVPSMVPKGGIHIPHKEASKAARLLGIDYADAVTGFEFKNRMASPVFSGVVVAREYKEAAEEVVKGFLEEMGREEEFKRDIEALKRWRRFLLKLRIRERLSVYNEPEVEGSKDKGKGKEKMQEMEHPDTGGGFFAEDSGGGFVNSDVEGESGGGFLPGEEQGTGGGVFPENEEGTDNELSEDPEDKDNEDMDWF